MKIHMAISFVVVLLSIALFSASTEFHLIYKMQLPEECMSIAFGGDDQVFLTSFLDGNYTLITLHLESEKMTNKSLDFWVSDIDFNGTLLMLTEQSSNYYIIHMDTNLHIIGNISIIPPRGISYYCISGLSVIGSEIFVLVHVYTGNITISQIWNVHQNGSSKIVKEVSGYWSEETLDLTFWEDTWLLLDYNGTLRYTTGEIFFDAGVFVENASFFRVDINDDRIALLGFELNRGNSIILIFEIISEAINTGVTTGSAVGIASGVATVAAVSIMIGGVTSSTATTGVGAVSGTSRSEFLKFQISALSSRKEFPLKLLFSLSLRLSKIFRSKKLGRVSLARVFAGAFGWSTFVSIIFTMLHKYDIISLLSSIVASSGLIYSVIGLPLAIVLLKFKLVTSKLRKFITILSIGLAINGIMSSSYALLCNLIILFAIATIILIVLAGIIFVGIILLGLSE